MIPASPVARRILALVALVIAGLGLVLLATLRRGSPTKGTREVALGVNEVISLDGAGNLLRLTTLARDPDGNHLLVFADAGGLERAVEVRSGRPGSYGGRTLTLLDVRRDRDRGGAVQLQWRAEGAPEPGPLFSVEMEPVPLPVPDSPFTVMLVGAAPAPGPGPRTTRLRVAGDRGVLVEAELAAGGDLEVPGFGSLRWLGTQERYVVRLRID